MEEKSFTPIGRFYHFFATGGYSGLFPFAPGTAGTIVGMLLFEPLSSLPFWAYLLFLIVIYPLCELSADYVEHSLNEEDPSIVVIDEIYGYLVAMAFLPATAFWMFAAFLLFRFFDILKPGLRPLEAMGGGRGIMLDDVGAGLYTGVLLLILHTAFPAL